MEMPEQKQNVYSISRVKNLRPLINMSAGQHPASDGNSCSSTVRMANHPRMPVVKKIKEISDIDHCQRLNGKVHQILLYFSSSSARLSPSTLMPFSFKRAAHTPSPSHRPPVKEPS